MSPERPGRQEPAGAGRAGVPAELLSRLQSEPWAHALGVEAATVRQRVHRARLMLRGYLSDLVGVKP